MVLNTITRILKRFLIKGQKYFKNANLAALTENIEHIHLYYQLCNFNFVFFQDDVGSVITDISSISGDPGHIEDTPLASGQEPPENLLFDPFGATGSATNLSGATQNKSNKNSNSDATLPSNEASVSFADFPNYFVLPLTNLCLTPVNSFEF